MFEEGSDEWPEIDQTLFEEGSDEGLDVFIPEVLSFCSDSKTVNGWSFMFTKSDYSQYLTISDMKESGVTVTFAI